MTSTEHTTKTITSPTHLGTSDKLAAYSTDAYAVEVAGDGSFVLRFTDADAAIEAVTAARDAAFRQYVQAGGNPRNKRSFSSQFAGVKRAIEAAR